MSELGRSGLQRQDSSSALANAGYNIMADTSAIPNLPGYGFRRKPPHFHRNMQFEVVGGVRVEHKEGVTFEKPKLVKMQRSVDNRRHGGTMPVSTATDEYQDTFSGELTDHPAWDALDRHVLRFYGYFKEAVVESNLENYRTRHCVINYHLEDDTAHILERKSVNSGMPQGSLLRRHRFPGPEGGYLNWADLQVGGLLQAYGRTIFLTDCDGFTRQYYENQGMPQNPPDDAEVDNFHASQAQLKDSGPHGIPRTAERLYREVMLGGGHVNEDMQQFLEYDRKVCRFYCVMDDLTLPAFERRPFVILFFLADNTVEIREQYPMNCGRDNYPRFFRKNKMRRGKTVLDGPLVQQQDRNPFVQIQDFAVGRSHDLQGCSFYIYDADPFTRKYFEEELGVHLEPCKDVRLPDRTVPKPSTPPYTGYGSWDDSMASVLDLIPKQPKKDFKKLFDNEGKILRFICQLYKGKPEDADRHFVVNFHLFDDTLSIHEPPTRNSGIITGRFLEKGVHLNQNTGNLFTPEDFHIGAVIKVYNREFEIIDYDEFTRRYYEKEDTGGRYDLEAVLAKIREGMRQSYPLVRDVFRRFDNDKDGVLTLHEFKQGCERFGFMLTDKEVTVIMKHFDSRQDGQVSYNEFCDALLDEDYTTGVMQVKGSIDSRYDPDYDARAQHKVKERNETARVRDATRKIGDVLYKNANSFHKLFKEFGNQTHENNVSVHGIVEAMKMNGYLFSLEDVTRCVLFVMGNDVDLEHISYVDFLKALGTSYHEMSAIR